MSNEFPYPSEFGTHPNIIYEIVKSSNCQKYLELGIYDATCIKRIANIVKKAVGVDIKKLHNETNFTFIQDTTDNFFTYNQESFDIIFIDADHSFESAKKDFSNSLKFLNKSGIILLHDTDPMYKYLLDPGYCGDSYKMHDYIKENYPELDIINLPIGEAGLMIVNKKDNQRHLLYK